MKELYFPKNIKRIGRSAFYGTNLKRIEVPESLEDIEEAAFGRTNLEEIKFLGRAKREVFMQLGKLLNNFSRIIIEVPNKKDNREILFYLQDGLTYAMEILPYIDSYGVPQRGLYKTDTKSLAELWKEIQRVYREASREIE